MPRVPHLPPADRVFARVDRFECECPACGRLVHSAREYRNLPQRLEKLARRRQRAVEQPDNVSVRKLRWNPALQRLRCPHCATVYLVGLLLFPVTMGQRRLLVAPPDVRMTATERRQLRHLTGGFAVTERYQVGDPVNLVVEAPCSCPEKGWSRACAVHGDPGGER